MESFKKIIFIQFHYGVKVSLKGRFLPFLFLFKPPFYIFIYTEKKILKNTIFNLRQLL